MNAFPNFEYDADDWRIRIQETTDDIYPGVRIAVMNQFGTERSDVMPLSRYESNKEVTARIREKISRLKAELNEIDGWKIRETLLNHAAKNMVALTDE